MGYYYLVLSQNWDKRVAQQIWNGLCPDFSEYIYFNDKFNSQQKNKNIYSKTPDSELKPLNTKYKNKLFSGK